MKRLVLLLAASFAAPAVFAADLLDFYREAQGNDSQFAAARAQLEAGRERGPQGRAGLLPSVVLNGATTYNQSDVQQPVQRDSSYNSNSYQVQLTQPLFRWQNWVAAKQGNLQVGIAEAQFNQAQTDLVLRVAQAYFDVLYAQDTLATVRTLRTAAGEQLELARRSFEVGTVTITDVHEAQSRHDLAAAQEIAAESDLEVKRQALRLLTGREPQALATLRPGVQIAPPQPADMEAWVASAEKGNFTVQAQQLSLEVAQREVERQRAAHFPTVDVVASYGRNHSGSSGSTGQPSEARSAAVGLQLQVPLYQGGIVQSRVREALALSDRARADLDTVRRNAAQATRQAYLGVTSGIAQVRGYEAALVSSRSSVDANRLGYEVGVRINIDVLNAQSQLADTQQRLARARYDALLAQLRLKGAAGTLSVSDVQQVNDLLTR